ncbi:MAG: Hsp70 family protein [Anaerolineaceae bacterium]|jgi:molecular chaperone DnaK (HSP70)
MTGRLAVDFGTSNTLIAVWDGEKKEGVPLHLPEFGRIYQQGGEEISVIPSLIHYAAHPQDRRWIGAQVLQKSLYDSPRTFRWMKRYISHRSPYKVNLDGRELTPYIAGKDFLTTLLVYASQELNLRDEEIALTVPVEAYEHYENWLTSAVEATGIKRYRLIDEPSAAALGYGAHIQPGNVYLIFDFGGGTMHSSVILIEPEEVPDKNRRCRVLGKAGKDIGGATVDQWIYEKILHLNRFEAGDETIREISNSLLVECEKVKETLSFSNQTDLQVVSPKGDLSFSASLSRTSFEDLLEQHNLFSEIDQMVHSAINNARERGYDQDKIQAALMLGGSSQIPSVQKALRQIFGKERVYLNRPLDAVARGAAAFVAGVDFFDHIQHDYAIRHLNPVKGDYDYHTIVNRGTPYPSSAPVARLVVKGSYSGQKKLGISIFEVGSQANRLSGALEIVFDPSGAARIMPISPHEEEQRSTFWMNEQSPTFLIADPPAEQGEARFEVEFNIDGNKRLTLTARELLTGNLALKNFPVVKLT